MLFEIRNYHVQPDLLKAYKAWGQAEAIPYLSQQLDVVGFWINTNDAPVIRASRRTSSARPSLPGSFDGETWRSATT